MTWYVWHDLHIHKFRSHLQYVLTIFAFFSRHMYCWFLYFALQSQIDPQYLFSWDGAVSKWWTFIFFLIPSKLSLSLLVHKKSLCMSLWANPNQKIMNSSSFFRKYLRHKHLIYLCAYYKNVKNLISHLWVIHTFYNKILWFTPPSWCISVWLSTALLYK